YHSAANLASGHRLATALMADFNGSNEGGLRPSVSRSTCLIVGVSPLPIFLHSVQCLFICFCKATQRAVDQATLPLQQPLGGLPSLLLPLLPYGKPSDQLYLHVDPALRP